MRTLAENCKYMELGPLQKLWIASLRAYPERQTTGMLGATHTIDKRSYEACCLGELHLCYHRMKHKKLPFNTEGVIVDGKKVWRSTVLLTKSFRLYGLRSAKGKLREPAFINDDFYRYLSSMNDHGLTWLQIADYVEANPDNVFTHSV